MLSASAVRGSLSYRFSALYYMLFAEERQGEKTIPSVFREAQKELYSDVFRCIMQAVKVYGKGIGDMFQKILAKTGPDALAAA